MGSASASGSAAWSAERPNTDRNEEVYRPEEADDRLRRQPERPLSARVRPEVPAPEDPPGGRPRGDRVGAEDDVHHEAVQDLVAPRPELHLGEAQELAAHLVARPREQPRNEIVGDGAPLGHALQSELTRPERAALDHPREKLGDGLVRKAGGGEEQELEDRAAPFRRPRDAEREVRPELPAEDAGSPLPDDGVGALLDDLDQRLGQRGSGAAPCRQGLHEPALDLEGSVPEGPVEGRVGLQVDKAAAGGDPLERLSRQRRHEAVDVAAGERRGERRLGVGVADRVGRDLPGVGREEPETDRGGGPGRRAAQELGEPAGVVRNAVPVADAPAREDERRLVLQEGVAGGEEAPGFFHRGPVVQADAGERGERPGERQGRRSPDLRGPRQAGAGPEGRPGHRGEGPLVPGELADEVVLGRGAPDPVEEAPFEEADLVDVARGGGGVPLVDPGEVLDLLGVELPEPLRDREAVGPGVLEHPGRAVERLLDDLGAARPAELSERSPLRAPEAADVPPDGRPAARAEVARLPVEGLRRAARLADGAHLLLAA